MIQSHSLLVIELVPEIAHDGVDEVFDCGLERLACLSATFGGAHSRSESRTWLVSFMSLEV
jgi:hypothetical protein